MRGVARVRQNIAQRHEEIEARRAELTRVHGEQVAYKEALEAARGQKLIGHPLDAAVTISATGDAYDQLQHFAADLRSLLIVSQASLVKDSALENAYLSDDIEGLLISVTPAPGAKCERCWVHDTTVGSHSDQPTICQRCKDALDQI